MSNMRAVWGIGYDFHADKRYNLPCCPECEEPIGKFLDDEYRCYSCGEVVEVTDEKMKEWLKIRGETKTEYHDCLKLVLDGGVTLGCDGKNCVETHYRRNPVTLEWQVMGSVCKNCGMRSIV